MATSPQQAFAATVRSAERPLPGGLRCPESALLAHRFSVYRNNHYASLIDALRDTCPAVARLVGDEFFTAMAGSYVAAHAPDSPVMLEYGDRFADFVAAFEPAANLPYLADVARLEYAWYRAYHAAEADSLRPGDLTDVAPDRAGDLLFRFHPSVQLLDSTWPVLSIWEANADPARDGSIAPDLGPESILIVRPRHDVQVLRLPDAGYEFLTALGAGSTLSQSAQRAQNTNSGFDLPANLQGLLESGAVIDYALTTT